MMKKHNLKVNKFISNKNDLIYNVLISNYLLHEEKEKRKKQEIVIKDLKNSKNNYNKNNNNISKKNNKKNSDKSYSTTNNKDYKISENQSLRNYLYEINSHNKIINDNFKIGTVLTSHWEYV